MRFTISILLLLGLIGKSACQSFSAGSEYKDSTTHIAYHAGNLPIILSAPHGGSSEPDSIPDRVCAKCATQKDAWTKPIAEGVYNYIVNKTGCYPHLIVNNLHRIKLDANREIEEAALGNKTAKSAWNAYQLFIDSSKAMAASQFKRALFLDFHGHGHDSQRIELGYLLSRANLQKNDSNLNSNILIQESSIRSLVNDNISGLKHSELLRGSSSFGALLGDKGFPAMPSDSIPFPEGNIPYFNGGYNTQRHGSRDNNGSIDAIQIEMNQSIRFTEATRLKLIDSLAQSILEFIDIHYFTNFSDKYCTLSNESMLNTFTPLFTMYPNPSAGFLTFESNLNVPFEIQIITAQGLTVLCSKEVNQKLDISGLPKGIYCVMFLQNGRVIQTSKLLKVD